MSPSKQRDNNPVKRGTKRILKDLTNLRISDDDNGKKKLRILITDTVQVEERTNSSPVFVEAAKSSEDVHCTHQYPCYIKKFIKDGHLFSRDYIEDIAKSLAQNEEKYVDLFPDPHYFPSQSDIRPRMRTILFTWITEVHVKYNMKRDVILWAAFQICDRYLSRVDSHRRELQLIGCTALWIASKYHEIHPPLANDFVNISDNAFTKNDLFTMEARICELLNYQFTIPNAFQYLDRYTDIALDSIHEEKVKNRVKWLARYGMERFNLHVHALEYCPSLLAAGALFAALKLTSNNWTRECELCSGYRIQNFLRSNGHELNLFEKYKRSLLDFDSDLHRAVIEKYRSSERGSVSTLRKKAPSSRRRLVVFQRKDNMMEKLY